MKDNELKQPSKTFIVTVGLSAVTNYKKEKKHEIIDETDLMDHLYNNYRNNPNKTSGELKTLKLLDFQPGSHRVHLLTTDTDEGKKAGYYIQTFLINKLNTPRDHVLTVPIPGLQVKDTSRFLNEGALNLLKQIKQIKENTPDKTECLVISTGGFKSVFPILSDACKKYQLELKYVFESEDEVISLPPDRDAFYDSLKERHHITLAKELLNAQFKYVDLSSPCHPMTIDQVPPASLFLDQFKKKGGLENYKALYYISPEDMKKIKQDHYYYRQMERRLIRLDTLKKIFGKHITLKTSIPDNQRIQLPIAPGMLFIICTVEFLEEMGIREIELSWHAPEEQDGRAVMEIPLKDSERFKQGIPTGGGGKGIELFRKLLSCRSESLLTIAHEKQREEIIYNWPPQPLADGNQGHSPIYPAILKWEICEIEGKIKLWWYSRKKAA